MSILNVNQIQPVGSGQTVTISAANIDTGSATVTASNLTINGNAYPNAGPLSNRNLVINGDMRIDQRNAGASVTPTDAYTVDRWEIREDTDGAVSVQQVSEAPTGFQKSLKVTVTTADSSLSATQRCLLDQRIEGFNTDDLDWGTANAKTVTLSFWVRSSLTGTFGGSLINHANNRAYPYTYSISAANTWEPKVVTITGDTSGTWETTNLAGIKLYFGLGAGSTYSGTAGAWAASEFYTATSAVSVIGTLNATWQITGVQLEVGTVATPFEHRNFGDELARCQRYYQKSYDYGTTPGSSSVYQGAIMHGYTSMPAANYVARFGAQFRTSMRAQPTVVTYDSAGNSGKCNYPDTTTNQSFTLINRGENNFSAETSSLSNGTDARVYFHYTAEAEL